MELRLAKKDVGAFLQGLAAWGKVIVPAQDGDVVTFRPMESGQEVALGGALTDVPAKGWLLPQAETLFRFRAGRETATIEEPQAPEPQVLFGVRPCDTRSAELVARLYGDDAPDGLYQTRRQKTLLVSVACEEPRATCFCTSFGYGPAAGEGADVILTPVDEDTYHVEGRTEMGRQALAPLGLPAWEAGSIQAVRTALAERVRLQVDTQDLAARMADAFEDDYWQALGARCLSCGACTYLCPTCHCFDMRDGRAERYRVWDSCMYPAFTTATDGHTPRPGKGERVRQRMMHKLRYFQERYGEQLCVGCGRCVEFCPVHIDICQVSEDMQSEGEVNRDGA